MPLLREVKERRLIPLMAAYLVTGFVALEAMDQLISYGFVPEIAYPVTLVLYLFGIVSSLIFAWFHGAPGRQYAPRLEVVLQSGLAIVAVATGVYVYGTQAASFELAEQMGLSPTSIAVLPFEDVSAGGDLEYVADGITDALIEQLDDIRSLDVISKTGVSPFRASSLRPDSIARVLSVGTIITGSVDQRGGEIRISTSLVDGVNGADIDRAAVQIPADNFLSGVDSVAATVAGLLRERLGEDVRVRELRAGTDNEDSWALAQRAERLRTDTEDRFDGGGDLESSILAFEQVDSLLQDAETLDSDWVRLPGARAHAAYRRAWFAANMNDMSKVAEEIDVGLAHAERALALDPDDAYGLEQLGTLKVLAAGTIASSEEELLSLLDEAQADLERSVDEDPSLATAHAMLSFLFMGIPDEFSAVLSAERALEEDAYLRGADRVYDRLAYAHYDLANFRQAQTWCDQGRSRFSDNGRFIECQLWLMAAPSTDSNVEEAWELLAQLDSLTPQGQRDYKHNVGLILVAGVLRNVELADSATSVLTRVDRREEIDPQRQLLEYEAGILASTGDPEGAIEALRRWLVSAPDASGGVGGDDHWWWRSLQGRPEFEELVSRN